MLKEPYNYSIFFDFIESYLPSGFSNIDCNHPIMKSLDERLGKGKQFFYIADLIQLKFLYTSKGSIDLMGIPSDQLDFSHFMEYVHPDDAKRLNIGRTKLLKMAQDFYSAEKGTVLLSTNMRYR